MNANDIIKQLLSLGKTDRIAGMARAGIDTSTVVGVTVAELRQIAKELGTAIFYSSSSKFNFTVFKY